MSEPKFTPGPWRVEMDSSDQPNIYAGENRDHWIALLPHQCVIPIKEQQDINARLIAAAPELRVALSEARYCIAIKVPRERKIAALRTIDAAMKKADGK